MVESFREQLERARKPLLALAGLAVLALIVWWFVRPAPIPPLPVVKMYVVDEETGEESLVTSHDVPPLMGKQGRPTLVNAAMVSFDGGQTHHPAWYEKYTDEAKDLYMQIQRDPRKQAQLLDRMNAGRLIRRPTDTQWVPILSAEGEAITRSIVPPPGGTVLFLRP